MEVLSKMKKEIPFKIDSNRCWMCGKEFVGGEKTMHHAIPRMFKPLLNVLIPICRPCHDQIHKEMLKAENAKTKLIKIKKEIAQFEKILFKK